jgi:hypothetical protein
MSRFDRRESSRNSQVFASFQSRITAGRLHEPCGDVATAIVTRLSSIRAHADSFYAGRT